MHYNSRSIDTRLDAQACPLFMHHKNRQGLHHCQIVIATVLWAPRAVRLVDRSQVKSRHYRYCSTAAVNLTLFNELRLELPAWTASLGSLLIKL